jgi:ribosome-associated protein
MAAKRANTSRRSGSAAAKAKSAKRPAAKKTARAAGGAAGKVVAKKSAAPTARKAKSVAAAKPVKAAAADPVSQIVKVVEGALDEMKAVQVKVLDVRQLTDIADTLIIASGNSDRHVRSIAERVLEHAKKAGLRSMGVEGQRDGEWVLVDLQDVIVHIMLPRVREIYRLENLWDVSAARREAAMEKVAV